MTTLLVQSGHDDGAAPAHDHLQHGPAVPAGKPPAGDAARYIAFTRDMHSSMQMMWVAMHRDPPSGDPDVDFLAMMVPHHWGAVEMARLVLIAGRDPLVRALAEDIIASQTSEMNGMRGRLEAIRSGREPGGGFPSPSGNRGPGAG